jgi:cytochrome c peroxidase
MKSLLIFLLSFNLLAQVTDDELDVYISQFKMAPLKALEGKDQKLFNMGEKLFNSKNISGYRNISCRDCHNPDTGTCDNLPLSLGQGRITHLGQVYQGSGVLLKRNSPALYNLGYPEYKNMFWDARVRYNGKFFVTPEPAFNGPTPQASHITKNLDSALEMQVIFPMVSREEMLGFGSPLDGGSNLESWRRIILRFWNEDKEFMISLAKYFEIDGSDINISHFAKVLAHFISFEFNVTDTPYDRYLRGDRWALSQVEKDGLKIYLTKGRCAVCHGGEYLTNFAIQNIGTPKIQKNGESLDMGLYHETADQRHRFLFKNPSLRNIAKSAPYMHNGSLSTLREVVEHYNNIKLGLDNYIMPSFYQIPYTDLMTYTNTSQVNELIYSGVFQPFLRKGLSLDEYEIDALTQFLENGLTEVKN